MEQDSVHGFRVSLTGFEDCFIREKFTHTGSPPFPRAVAARQARYAAPLYCVIDQYTRRSLVVAGAESNSARKDLFPHLLRESRDRISKGSITQ